MCLEKRKSGEINVYIELVCFWFLFLLLFLIIQPLKNVTPQMIVP